MLNKFIILILVCTLSKVCEDNEENFNKTIRSSSRAQSLNSETEKCFSIHWTSSEFNILLEKRLHMPLTQSISLKVGFNYFIIIDNNLLRFASYENNMFQSYKLKKISENTYEFGNSPNLLYFRFSEFPKNNVEALSFYKSKSNLLNDEMSIALGNIEKEKCLIRDKQEIHYIDWKSEFEFKSYRIFRNI